MSVVVITRNEEKNIVRCLASVTWADEVVVVDNGSTDATLDHARRFANVTLISSAWFGYSETRRVGVRTARNDWIFWLDADEAVPPALAEELRGVFSPRPPLRDSVLAVSRKTYFLGRHIRGCGWYPGTVVRLFHRAHADFNDNVLHEGIESPPGTRTLTCANDLLHDSYVSLQSYFSKMVRYGEFGASELARRKHPPRLSDLALRPAFAFLRSYVLKRGARDGVAGFVISVGTAFSVFIKYATHCFLVREGAFERRRPLEPWEQDGVPGALASPSVHPPRGGSA